MHFGKVQAILAVRQFGGRSGMIWRVVCRNWLHFYRITCILSKIGRKKVYNFPKLPHPSQSSPPSSPPTGPSSYLYTVSVGALKAGHAIPLDLLAAAVPLLLCHLLQHVPDGHPGVFVPSSRFTGRVFVVPRSPVGADVIAVFRFAGIVFVVSRMLARVVFIAFFCVTRVVFVSSWCFVGVFVGWLGDVRVFICSERKSTKCMLSMTAQRRSKNSYTCLVKMQNGMQQDVHINLTRVAHS